MRILCLSAALCAAMVSPALAQSPAPATPAVAPAVTLTSGEVRTLKMRIATIDSELRKELTVYFRTVPGAGNPVKAAATAVDTGTAFVTNPVSEKHRLLVAERKEIAARLLAAGQEIPKAGRTRALAPPQPSAAMRAPRGVQPIRGVD